MLNEWILSASIECAVLAYDGLREPPVHFGGATHSTDWTRGALALRLAHPLEEAEAHFAVGLATCTRERAPVEAGRCHQGLADVAERRGDLEGAREHLDAAATLFAQYGAKRYLEQVLAKKQLLGA